MAQKTITANATASLTAAGTSTATGSITWTAPALPDGVSAWDSVRISGKWTWNGKGSVSRVTINGTNTSDGIAFDISIAGKSSPLSITCVGNKNATGANFRWTSLIVTYTYTDPFSTKTCTITYNGRTIATTEEDGDVNITYNGSRIASAVEGTKTLKCNGNIMASNVIVGSKTLQCNGKLMSGDVIVTVT